VVCAVPCVPQGVGEITSGSINIVLSRKYPMKQRGGVYHRRSASCRPVRRGWGWDAERGRRPPFPVPFPAVHLRLSTG